MSKPLACYVIISLLTMILFFYRLLTRPRRVHANLDLYKLWASRALNRKELLNLHFQLSDHVDAHVPPWAYEHARGVHRYIEERLQGVGDRRDDAVLVMEMARHPNAPESYKTHGAEWLRRQTLALNVESALALTEGLKQAAQEALARAQTP